MVHGGEVAELHGQPVRLDGDVAFRAVFQRWDVHRLVAGRLLFRQQCDECRFQQCFAGPLQDFGGRSGGQNRAVIHGDQPVKALRLVHIGGGHQNTHPGPVLADVGDQVPELRPGERVDAGRRLVEDQEIRIMDQRAAKAELLFHAARQLAGWPVEERVQPGCVGQAVDPPAPLGRVMSEQAGDELQILLDRESRGKVLAEALRHIGDIRADRRTVGRVGDVAAKNHHLAVLDRAGSGDDRQERGFADAVRANETDHPARRNGQGHATKGSRLAVPLFKPGN